MSVTNEEAGPMEATRYADALAPTEGAAALAAGVFDLLAEIDKLAVYFPGCDMATGGAKSKVEMFESKIYGAPKSGGGLIQRVQALKEELA